MKAHDNPSRLRAGQIEDSIRIFGSNFLNRTFEAFVSIELFDCQIFECSGRTLDRIAKVKAEYKMY